MGTLFNERFSILVSESVGKDGKVFRNHLELAKKAGISDGTISKLKTKDIKNPDSLVLRKLSEALGRPNDYLSNLWLFCSKAINLDPEITYQATKLLEKKLTLKEFFKELFTLIYNTPDKEKQKYLLAEDFKFARDAVFNAFTEDNKPVYSSPETCISFAFNPNYHPDQEQIARTISVLMRYTYGIEPVELNEYIKPLLPKKENTDTQDSAKVFRYPSDNYEKRPVFKATGGKLKQYIESGFTGENGRSEWGYFKDMPNAFFVEVEGNSMIDSGIKDKDYCLINPSITVNDGDIVLAISGNTEATIKKFKKTSTGVILSPSNQEFEPIFIESKDAENWQFFKVVESRHKF